MEKLYDELIAEIKSLGYTIFAESFYDEAHAQSGIFNQRYWSLPEQNKKLKGSPFYYDTGKDFIHFTSLEALFGILNSKHIRLYNLSNMDDKYELNYALEVLSFKKYSGIQDKENLYCFSMCSASEVLDEQHKIKKHLLWKLHGRDGKGVVLKLKIINNLDTWLGFHLTKCFYSIDKFEKIKELNEIVDTKELLDIKTACFIKLPIYKFENEIRLVFDKRSPTESRLNGELLFPKIFPDKLNKMENISYFQLPLFNFIKDQESFLVPNVEGIEYEMPKIQIEEIILGYRYSEKELETLKSKIKVFDPNITVNMSDLKKFY